jgi:hypothetical protein
VKKVGNPAGVHIGSIHDVMTLTSGVTATLLVYAVPDTVEQPTPFACTPFSLLANGQGSAIAVSRSADDTFAYPAGTAVTLAANQLVRLELHYVNAATSAAMQLSASTTLTPIPDSSFQQEAGLLFLMDPDISIPPGAMSTLGPIYYPLESALGSPSIFAASGLENQYATTMTTGVTTGSTGTDTSVYAPSAYDWMNPPTVMVSPAVAVPAGGGFHATCAWNNVSGGTVTSGSRATNEICMDVLHYVPGKGSFVCVHTTQAGGIDACCPGGGSICSSLFP